MREYLGVFDSLFRLFATASSKHSSSKLRALKIIVIIYVDKFSNIKAHEAFCGESNGTTNQNK